MISRFAANPAPEAGCCGPVVVDVDVDVGVEIVVGVELSWGGRGRGRGGGRGRRRRSTVPAGADADLHRRGWSGVAQRLDRDVVGRVDKRVAGRERLLDGQFGVVGTHGRDDVHPDARHALVVAERRPPLDRVSACRPCAARRSVRSTPRRTGCSLAVNAMVCVPLLTVRTSEDGIHPSMYLCAALK